MPGVGLGPRGREAWTEETAPGVTVPKGKVTRSHPEPDRANPFIHGRVNPTTFMGDLCPRPRVTGVTTRLRERKQTARATRQARSTGHPGSHRCCCFIPGRRCSTSTRTATHTGGARTHRCHHDRAHEECMDTGPLRRCLFVFKVAVTGKGSPSYALSPLPGVTGLPPRLTDSPGPRAGVLESAPSTPSLSSERLRSQQGSGDWLEVTERG